MLEHEPPRRKKLTNPFYVALLLVGTMFCVTALAYVLMIAVRLRGPAAASASHPLIDFMDRHGATLLFSELAVLAVATFAAIGLDSWFEPASKTRSPDDQDA